MDLKGIYHIHNNSLVFNHNIQYSIDRNVLKKEVVHDIDIENNDVFNFQIMRDIISDHPEIKSVNICFVNISTTVNLHEIFEKCDISELNLAGNVDLNAVVPLILNKSNLKEIKFSNVPYDRIIAILHIIDSIDSLTIKCPAPQNDEKFIKTIGKVISNIKTFEYVCYSSVSQYQSVDFLNYLSPVNKLEKITLEFMIEYNIHSEIFVRFLNSATKLKSLNIELCYGNHGNQDNIIPFMSNIKSAIIEHKSLQKLSIPASVYQFLPNILKKNTNIVARCRYNCVRFSDTKYLIEISKCNEKNLWLREKASNFIKNTALVMYPLNLPVYVLMWILEWYTPFKENASILYSFSMLKMLRTIEGVYSSINKIKTSRPINTTN